MEAKLDNKDASTYPSLGSTNKHVSEVKGWVKNMKRDLFWGTVSKYKPKTE